MWKWTEFKPSKGSSEREGFILLNPKNYASKCMALEPSRKERVDSNNWN